MYSSGYQNASGYESTPVDRLTLNQSAKRPQISDAQLKTLPAFGYDGKQRFEFADGLRKLFTTWRLVWLVKNEPASSQVGQKATEGNQFMMGVSPTFFSPSDPRGRVGPGIRDDDLRPDPRGMASASHASVKQAEGYIPHHVGPSGQYGKHVQHPPSGVFSHPPSGVSSHPPTGVCTSLPPSGAFSLPPSGVFSLPPSGVSSHPPSGVSPLPPSGTFELSTLQGQHPSTEDSHENMDDVLSQLDLDHMSMGYDHQQDLTLEQGEEEVKQGAAAEVEANVEHEEKHDTMEAVMQRSDTKFAKWQKLQQEMQQQQQLFFCC